eukprot:3602494-Rhodomonas_salina.2
MAEVQHKRGMLPLAAPYLMPRAASISLPGVPWGIALWATHDVLPAVGVHAVDAERHVAVHGQGVELVAKYAMSELGIASD